MQGFLFFPVMLILTGVHELSVPMCISQVLLSNKNLRTAVTCLTASVYFHTRGSVGLWVGCDLADLGWAWLAHAGLQIGFPAGSRLKGSS